MIGKRMRVYIALLGDSPEHYRKGSGLVIGQRLREQVEREFPHNVDNADIRIPKVLITDLDHRNFAEDILAGARAGLESVVILPSFEGAQTLMTADAFANYSKAMVEMITVAAKRQGHEAIMIAASIEHIGEFITLGQDKSRPRHINLGQFPDRKLRVLMLEARFYNRTGEQEKIRVDFGNRAIDCCTFDPDDVGLYDTIHFNV